MDIKELKGHFDQAAAEMKSLVERQSDEIKSYGETTTQTAAQIKAVSERIESMQGDVKSFDEKLKDIEAKSNRLGFGAVPERKSLGQMFVESNQYKHARERSLKSVDSVQIEGSFFKKDITSAAASAGALIDAMRLPEIYRDPADRPQHVREFMAVGTTDSNAIEYMCEDVFTNNAAPQYAADPARFELVAKAKSNITFELKTVPVRTLAHYMVASRQVLDDANMLRSYIDNRLRYGLALEEDKQILYGTNTGGDLEGLMVNAGVQNAGAVAAGDTVLDHIRKAIALARLAEYPVTAIMINPTDWSNIELQKGEDGHYIWVTVPSGGEPRLWRVPVVETTAIDAGEFLLGNFTMGAQLWDRQQSVIRVSESHEDLFVKNGVVILGEERVALTTYRPKAFVKGSFAAAPVNGGNGGDGEEPNGE
jgi:HK97 family phage major capsid protein